MHAIEETDGNLMETKYQKIKSIEFKQTNKLWVVVTFENNTTWMPALDDIADIISKIGMCEDFKYLYGEGKEYTKKFIIDSIINHYSLSSTISQ